LSGSPPFATNCDGSTPSCPSASPRPPSVAKAKPAS
jgi:hypothetical protein